MKYHVKYEIEVLAFLAALLWIACSSPLAAQENPKEWLPFEKAIELANAEKKWVMVDVWAPWCGWCLKMQKEVYPALPDTLTDSFTFTKINYDNPGETFRYQGRKFSAIELLQKFSVDTIPAIVFLSSDGEYRFHFSGFIESPRLKQLLVEVAEHRRK